MKTSGSNMAHRKYKWWLRWLDLVGAGRDQFPWVTSDSHLQYGERLWCSWNSCFAPFCWRKNNPMWSLMWHLLCLPYLTRFVKTFFTRLSCAIISWVGAPFNVAQRPGNLFWAFSKCPMWLRPFLIQWHLKNLWPLVPLTKRGGFLQKLCAHLFCWDGCPLRSRHPPLQSSVEFFLSSSPSFLRSCCSRSKQLVVCDCYSSLLCNILMHCSWQS